MADRIRECQEADVALRKAALAYAKAAVRESSDPEEAVREARALLRHAARDFSWKVDLSHPSDPISETIDGWHEAYPEDDELTVPEER